MLGTCTVPPSLLEQIIASGEVRVVTRNTPATFYYGIDEPRGIDYELAKGFADHLGVKLHMYVAERFWQIFPDVIEGKAHVGAAGLTVTVPREKIVDFSPAYQTVRQEVIYRRGTRKPYGLQDMLDGELEILADAGEAFAIGPETPVAWALPKTTDTSLRESVSAYFAELHATGALNAILDRYYFSTKKDFDYFGSRAFVRDFESRLPKYKEYFLAAAIRTDFDWRLLAAMAYQESHWDSNAVSPTGVKGIMMLTSPTAEMLGVEDRTDPEQSIHGGAEYLVRVIKKVPERISEPDRTWLAIAAYNVGYGHLEDARVITQIQGGNPDSWQDVRERLPLLSEPNWFERVPRGFARGHEPVIYVDNVRRYYDILRWMTADENGATDEAGILADAAPL